MVKIKFIKPWRLHVAGAVVDVEPGVAEGLISQGRAVRVEDGELKKAVKKQNWVK